MIGAGLWFSAFILSGFGVYVLAELKPVLVAMVNAWREGVVRQDNLVADRLILDRDRLEFEREQYRDRRVAQTPPKANDPMPHDLMARVSRWEDEWAKEDELRYLRELYADCGDWDHVRRLIREADRNPEDATP